ncbi:molybdate ABC transporter substrate-binding protein [Aquisalimonas asiatica]|uniref:Molybdate transport system substrate-binding protein n=1 Tax=Aquisalimonas asiatica TaxID=406100 RepID=A0A1H8Q3V6_9GAMM|nr:molybdate ABC transporter substrate-binding protein [Aquisalimonas asiatica]SEO48899.1 molybdate transport system substrate-binding protein [Aquisalimonas asiatica]
MGARRAFLTTVMGLALASGGTTAGAQDSVRVAAASSLHYAMKDLVATFERNNDARVRVSFGASGALARQIRRGAPYAVFMAADERAIERLVDEDVIDDEGERYATGGLSLFVRQGAPLRAANGLEGLAAALDGKRLGRVAIPDPGEAPYGRAARDVLREINLWSGMQDHVAVAENAARAARMAANGPAQAGLVPTALAGQRALQQRGNAEPVPPELHDPINHRMVLLDGNGDENPADAFYAFILSDEGQAILQDHGFEPPAEE